jgi:hypothetical protein
MAVFLFVRAAGAVALGLVSLVAGRVFRTTGRKQGPRTAVES